MPLVYEYEIELRIYNRNTGQDSMELFSQYAYGPSDALTQVLLTQAGVIQGADVSVYRIGPPRRLIEAAAQQTEQEIQRVMKMIVEGEKR